MGNMVTRKTLRDKEYVLASERHYPGEAVVRSWVPVLTEEERSRRQKNLEEATKRFLQHVEEVHRQQGSTE